MKLPEISAADIKDWFARRAEPLTLDDEVIEEIAARGNARAQALEDERELARQKHAIKPNSELPNIKEETPTKGTEASTSMGDNSDTVKITHGD